MTETAEEIEVTKRDWCDGCRSARENVTLYVLSTITDVPRQVGYCRECHQSALDDGDTVALKHLDWGT